ncbi:MAG: MATE family efflux transporter [Synergistaceae bacterium]|jgi:putative MATE family efflux protein|nr:MATE family efflux transporter [Synergistaceae bacterium]
MEDRGARFMEMESIPRLLARFAGPAIVGMIANALYNIVDRVFVGHTVGADGIAAIALGFPCMLFFFAFAMLAGVGGASRLALQLGAKNREGAERALGNAVFLCLSAGTFFLVCAFLFVEPVLRASGASDALLPLAREYLSVVLWGILFSTLSYTGSCCIRARGSPAYAMGTQLVGALANVALDAYFVLGLDMGVRGAAAATVISQVLAALWVTAYFLSPRARLSLSLRALTPHWKTLRRIVTVGTPPFLMDMNFVLVLSLVNTAASKYGGDLAVSASGIFMSLDSLLFMPAIAVGEGMLPIVGYNYGARRPDRVREVIKWALGVTSVFYVVSFLVIQFYAEFFVRLFNNSDEALIALTARALRISYLAAPAAGVAIVTNSALEGLGRARDALGLSFARFFLFLLAPLLILPRLWGLYGAWSCFPLADAAGSAVALLYLRRVMREMKEPVAV